MYNILDYGAAEGGSILITDAFQQAIDACYDHGGGTVYIPAGTYLSGSVHLHDNVHIVFEAGAVILGSKDLSDFDPYEPFFPEKPLLSDPTPDDGCYQDRSHSYFHHSLIWAEDCHDISVTGLGKIDMQSVWDPSPAWCRNAKIIALKNCDNVVISDLTLLSATDLAVYFAGCENVRITKLFIRSHIDGISPDSCKNVVISDCILDVGDDAIVPKSSYTLQRFKYMENLSIANCVISSRCSAIKFGTESNTGFINTSITGCTIYNTRFSGIALEAADGALIDGFSASGITMRNVGNPFMFTVMDRGRAPAGTPIGRIRNVTLSCITATGPYEAWNSMPLNYDVYMKNDTVQTPVPVPCIIAGQKDSVIENVSLSDIQMTLPGGGSAEDRNITVPEVRDGYPESVRFGRKLPIYGLFARNVDNLKLYNVSFYPDTPDERDAILLENVTRYKEV